MSTATLTEAPRAIPDDLDAQERYEIIDGERVEVPPMGVKSSVLAFRLARLLCNFGIERDVGEAYTEVLFRLPLPVDRNRRPDAAFVPYSRWAKGRDFPDENAWDVLPDLCVEVVSPTDMVEDLSAKIAEYFRAGVRLVWVIQPRAQFVVVYDSPTSIRGLTRADALDGGAVLPGFRLPLADLFPDGPADPPEARP